MLERASPRQPRQTPLVTNQYSTCVSFRQTAPRQGILRFGNRRRLGPVLRPESAFRATATSDAVPRTAATGVPPT